MITKTFRFEVVMIMNVFGDTSRQRWLDFLPRQCRVTSQYSRLPGEICDPPPCGLALLAAVLRGQPGRRYEKDIWNLKETANEGTMRNGRNVVGQRMTEQEVTELDAHAINEYLRSIVINKDARPSTVILNPAEDWWHMMVVSIEHLDVQWAISMRERRIAESLYWLQREVPVILVTNEQKRLGKDIYEPNLALALERQCDVFVHIENHVGYLVFQRDHVGLPVKPGEKVEQEMVLESLGFLGVQHV